ncbi:MAG: VOC family protein [Chloroflexota bacterium]
MKIATNVSLKGEAEMALITYQELFGGKIICMHKYQKGMTDDPRLLGKLFHAELEIKGFYIYLQDTVEEYDYKKQAYQITVECDTFAEAEKYFDTLKTGGTVLTPITHMPYGPYIGHLIDKFGITWDIVYCEP